MTAAVTINSGDTVTVELITHHAGDYYEGEWRHRREQLLSHEFSKL